MDLAVTVPKQLWLKWLVEGDAASNPAYAKYPAYKPIPGWSGRDYHFWFGGAMPDILPGERVYIVAWGRLRGYAPLVAIEAQCRLRPERHCFLRRGGAVAVTIPETIQGFRGWRYRFWERTDEIPFPDWDIAGTPEESRPLIQGIYPTGTGTGMRNSDGSRSATRRR